MPSTTDRVRSPRWSTALVMAVLLLTGCTGDDPVDEPVAGDASESTPGERPDVESLLPDDRGEPPQELVVDDLAPGDGEAVVAGDVVVVEYVGVRWSDGVVFDASWERGQPFEFELGAGSVIEGWDRGVEGMRIGGRRMLTIPPEQAYGARGAGDLIGPDETLVFVVDLLETRPGA